MKVYFYIFSIFFALLFSCNSNKTVQNETESKTILTSDTVRIANDEIEYEVVVIDPGFTSWFNGHAKPKGFYNQSYLEARNIFWVTEWNRRVLLPMQYDPNLYTMLINYESGIDYGYEVNYMIYNYLVYFQLTNNQKLGGFSPRL